MHELHVTERRSFRGCRRRWNWIYRERRLPHILATPLEFGIAYHKAMEVFYDPGTWETQSNAVRRELAVAAFVDECEKHRDTFLAQVPVDDEDLLGGYDDQIELGSDMIRYHADRVSPARDKHLRPIATEYGFDVPFVHPDTGEVLTCSVDCGQDHPSGDEVHLVGKIDVVFRNLEDNTLHAGDWKTASRLSTMDSFLKIDDQINTYMLALRLGLGYDVRKFLYHEQRKAVPKAPKHLKNRKEGKLLSTDYRQLTDFQLFVTEAETYDPQAYERGLYDEYLNFLYWEGPEFYMRHPVTKDDEELRSAARDIFSEASDMLDPNLRIYPSPSQMRCNLCQHIEPCEAVFKGKDYEKVLGDYRYGNPFAQEETGTEFRGSTRVED